MKIKILLTFLIMFNLKNTLLADDTLNLYDFSFDDIDGNQVNLEKFSGKPILIVNTASRCGFTRQYEDLQNLFVNYKKSDLTIIATTSNSFNQEYSDNEDIKKICLVNYGVGFVTSSPMIVKGKEAHPFYIWARENHGKSAVPKWNFHKIIVDKNGKIAETFSSITRPSSNKFIKTLEKLIKS